ncbi:hypothetical protein ACQPZX_15610 [Actinoplanes sp. CA-142083]|uniref:hypothetical protein n=1 Tax=Actinoplanes sp. CA-142083 TaxID=3239903 RepID=UPI003D904388
MRSALWGLLATLLGLATGNLPGKHPGYLAVCKRVDCGWRRFIHEAQALGSFCSRHPGERRMAAFGEKISVRCFKRGCPNPSVEVEYQPGIHGPEDFRCPAHLRDRS